MKLSFLDVVSEENTPGNSNEKQPILLSQRSTSDDATVQSTRT